MISPVSPMKNHWFWSTQRVFTVNRGFATAKRLASLASAKRPALDKARIPTSLGATVAVKARRRFVGPKTTRDDYTDDRTARYMGNPGIPRGYKGRLNPV